MDIIHILPYHYVHIKNKLNNTTFLVEGPKTKVLQSHEEIILSPTPMIQLNPGSWIRIGNPVLIKDGVPAIEAKFQQVKLRFGEEEIRTYEQHQEPFSLFPGENQLSNITPRRFIPNDQCLKVSAKRPFLDDVCNVQRSAGDEWILIGPRHYLERVEVKVIEMQSGKMIKSNQALHLRALKNFTDQDNVNRIAGEDWLVRNIGLRFISPEEVCVEFRSACILNDQKAIHLKAKCPFTDIYGVKRNAGDEWIITNEISSTHVVDVNEEFIRELDKFVLTRWQYCIVEDYVGNDGKNLWGMAQLRKGETSFFLQPGENLRGGQVYTNQILSDEEALLLLAREQYEDEYGSHKPGERWMVYGPRNYVPDIEVDVLEVRRQIPLNDNEGIYIRDIHTGEVSMISGKTYMLRAHEELWAKELPQDVEILLSCRGKFSNDPKDKEKYIKQMKVTRDKSRVVTYSVPHNSLVQVFDYREKKNYIYLGPTVVKLGPYEQFTVLYFSSEIPKVESRLMNLVLHLGPDFISDEIVVETSDHAKLRLRLSYSWKFEIDRNNEDDLRRLFTVKDFIGDCCKSIASRIRGIVSSVNFDSFHKDSSNIVQSGVFGKDAHGKLKKPLKFKDNKLVITNVDIQSQEPIDKQMRSILNESMILSMQTNLEIQQSEAKHKEEYSNQDAKGKVEIKQIQDDTENESKRLTLLKLKAENYEIETTGLAESEVKAICSEKEINAESDLEKVRNEFLAKKLKREAELESARMFFVEELAHFKRMSDLEVEKAQALSDSTVDKLQVMVDAIGKETLVEMAKAGPEGQAKLLGSLGVKSMLVTDGKSPLNLFNTANGMISAPQQNNSMCSINGNC